MQIVICKKKYERIVSDLKKYYRQLDDEGCFFVMYSTEYDDKGNVRHDIFQVIKEAVNIGYSYVNTIVYPSTEFQHIVIEDNVRYVIWFCKNPERMKFNKDPIREKHIWKDVEWGKRAKNYNPKGKDPGNVWIPTEDDGKANITKHLLLSDDDVIKRLLAMSCCGDNYIFEEEKVPLCNVKREKVQYSNIEKRIAATGKVIFATSENMDKIEDCSVQTVITSPPYWNLKNYFKDGQIGQEPYTSYLSRIQTVWEQCFKKLNSNGSMWININIRSQKGKVILIPYDIIEQCKKIGFYYKGILIWHKSSGIPTGEKNIVDRHEYVLIFSKSEDFITDMTQYTSVNDYKNPEINGGAFWNINKKAGSVGKKYIHPAIYPNELVRRIISLSSSEGDLIMDPFLGSGTSLIASLNENRNFVGYEYNEGFKELMESRFSAELNCPEKVIFL